MPMITRRTVGFPQPLIKEVEDNGAANDRNFPQNVVYLTRLGMEAQKQGFVLCNGELKKAG